MGTKQVKMEFQVAANDGALAQVTVTAGGTQVFSGALAQTVGSIVIGDVHYYTEPFSLVEFELNVDNMPVPPGNSNSYGQWTTSTDITIAVSGGSVCLQETLANYTAQLFEVTPSTTPPTPPRYQIVAGNASTFATLRYATQPVWTPAAVGRLDIADNVNTGPGTLLLLDDESVTYQVAMTLYSA
jgi:hypothetical protein